MAINVTFNGATIYKPGAYSEEIIDLGGGFPLSPTGLVAIFGESVSGPSGSTITDFSQAYYTPDQLPAITSLYGSGPIVDACTFLFAPGADGALPGGAQQVYIYKTNNSTQASLALSNNFGTLDAASYGTSGNLITYQDVAVPAQPAQTSSTASFNVAGAPFDQIVSGSPHLNDALAQEAQSAAMSAYLEFEGETQTPISATLDGQTLVPGVYSTGAASLAGSGPATLTFNGAGVYVIVCASTLVTGAGGIPTMTLENGATANDIYWVVGSSATINSGFSGVFQGNVLADTSITDTLGGTVNGSLIALGGAVTFSAASIVHSQASSLLGAAGSFAALANSTITNTGSSFFYGNVGTSPGTSVTLGGGTIVAGAGLTLVLRINGAASSLDNTFTLPSGSVTRALLQSALSSSGNWSLGLPSGMTFTVSGSSDSAAYLTIAQSLASNPQRNGYGQNFQLVSGSLLSPVNILPGLYTSETEDMSVITIDNTGTLTIESGTVGGQLVLEVGYIGGSSVGPVVTVNATNMLLINNSVIQYTIPLANFNSLYALVQFINGSTGGNWSAALPSTLVGQLPTSSLDQVSNVGANSSNGSLPAQIKDDSYSVDQFFSQSSNVELVQSSGQGVVGLPDPQGPTYLAGGTLGGTQSADIVDALAAIQSVHVNSIVPLFSRDASQDILDLITDPSSNYTIDAIHQAVKTFLSLQATVKQKSECQGYLSLKDTYLNCKLQSQNLADARIQLVIQDQLQTSSLGVLQWYLPWAGACLLAGARGGAPVGLPMTFKYFNTSGIRQTAQLLSTPESQIVIGFNPATQYDDAIQNGITFWEKPPQGGYRLVVDNTTYGADANWVYNRANVLYAADVLAYDFRQQLENIYVGVKNTVSAAEVSQTCAAILNSYLAQGITVSTSDAANGYKQLVVQIVGNTINISVTVKLVEGIDFVLATITLQRASSTA
jgi:hypothetical protein